MPFLDKITPTVSKPRQNYHSERTQFRRSYTHYQRSQGGKTMDTLYAQHTAQSIRRFLGACFEVTL